MMHALRRFVIVLALLAVAMPTAVAAPQQPVTLLFVSDTHSHLAAWGPKDAALDGTLGGLAKAAAIVAGEKYSNPDAVFVHGGDLMGGDLFFNEYLGVPEFLLLQQVGLDVFVPGNHEFHFGPDFLAGVLDATWTGGSGGVPVLGTNIDISEYPALGLWMSSRLIKDAGGVKVGFFGVTTPFDALERPYPVVIRTDLAAVAADAAAKLRADGAQVVVCVAHTGLELSRDIARTAPGIDVILNGHDHVALAKPEAVAGPGGGTTIIVSAGEYYRWVARLKLSASGGRVSVVDYGLLGTDAAAPAVPEVQAAVDYLKAGIVDRYGDVYHQQLAWADKQISKSWDPRHDKRDTALGNLFTDAYRNLTNTDIALEATGFLDESLPEGAIVGADVFRSMSYGMPAPDPALGRYIVYPFHLATFRLTGAELLASLEIGVSSGVDLFPQVSGLRFEFDSSRPFGSRVLVTSIRVGTRSWDPDELYSVTANEGLVMFLPSLGVNPRDVSVLTASAFDAARAFVEQRGVLGPVVTGRIRDVASIPGKSR